MIDPYASYILLKQPTDLEAALVLFDEDSKGPDRSSPHAVTWEWMERNLCWNTHRQELLVQLREFTKSICHYGAIPQLLLIGGSYVSTAKTPKDVDFLLIYSVTEDFNSNLFVDFIRAKRIGLDYRLIPSDTGLLSIIKITIFYHLLYQGRKGGKGSVILKL